MPSKTATRRKRKKRAGPRSHIVKAREADKPGPNTSRQVIDGAFEVAVKRELSKRVR